LRAASTFWAHQLKLPGNVPNWPTKIARIIQEESFEYEEVVPTFSQKFWRAVKLVRNSFTCPGLATIANMKIFLQLGGAVALLAFAAASHKRPKTTATLLTAAAALAFIPKQAAKSRKVVLSDSCVGRMGKFELADGKFTYNSVFHKCVGKELSLGFTFLNPAFINVGRSCSCNESVAIAERQCTKSVETKADRKALWDEARVELEKQFKFPVYDRSQTTGVLRDKFYSSYPEARRKVLQAAAAALDVGCEYNADSSIFVKREVIVGKTLQDFQPRAISSKSEMYLMRTGPCFKEWWNQVVETHFSSVYKSLESRFIYTGKMTGDEVGLLVTHMEQNGYYPTEMDCSRFDGHVEVEALEAELAIYEKVLPKTLVDDLRMQLNTKGRSATGAVKFRFAGKRASGVINTSAGNTIVAWMMMALFFKKNSITDFFILQIGDDNLTFTRKKLDEPAVISLFADLGHKLKVIARERDEYDLLEYCSGRFWRVGEQRVLQPKIGKLLSKTFISVKPIAETDLLPYCTAIVRGMFYYRDFPGMRPLIEAFGVDQIGFKERKDDNPHSIKLRIELVVDRSEIADQFNRVYGFTLDSFENELSSFNLLDMGVVHSSDIVDRVLRVDGCHP